MQVVPGVSWIRMPMPFGLDHINLWRLEDQDGWAVVDTGLCTEEILEAWYRIFSTADGSRPLTRVIATHMHSDHAGMAGWLAQKFDCSLWMSQLEYLSCRVMLEDVGSAITRETVAFYRQAGWGDEAMESYHGQFGRYDKFHYPLPESYRRIKDGEEIRIGQNMWRVITGSGHSPEHASLYCGKLKVLISGDQVLPRISSNVSVGSNEPEANPMLEWLQSLEKIKREVPDDVLVLPSHGDCFYGLHERLDQLISLRKNVFERLYNALQEPRRVVDLFMPLCGRNLTLDGSETYVLATGELLAYLNYFLHRGEIKRQADESGVNWYQRL